MPLAAPLHQRLRFPAVLLIFTIGPNWIVLPSRDLRILCGQGLLSINKDPEIRTLLIFLCYLTPFVLTFTVPLSQQSPKVYKSS
jgi:hypothetical protein